MSLRSTLGKYHILERLAADDFSEIYKVKTIGIAGFEKIQILKYFLPACSHDPKFIRSFVDQAKIAFSLNHRNIVQVFEFGKIDGDLFLAMEHIQGTNLYEIIQRSRMKTFYPPVSLTCYLMGEIAAGLEYAHRKSDHFGQELCAIHCDITPRCIACSFEGSVKILDFGISRAVWDFIPFQQRQLWDPSYLSPEQIAGDELDAKTDLFSFGTILWELLTSRPLFSAESFEGTLHNILNRPVPNPRSLNPDVPVQLDDLTLRCLNRDRAQRIENANVLQQELHRIQRSLGAVIGSRSLSTFIEELFSSSQHRIERDVRQVSAAKELPRELPEVRPSGTRTDELLIAAAELAKPFNPPPLQIEEKKAAKLPPAHPKRDLPKDIFSPNLNQDLPGLATTYEPSAIVPTEQTIDPLSRLTSNDSEHAGVLRSGRHPDEEVTVSARRPSSTTYEEAELFQAQEVLARSPLHRLEESGVLPTYEESGEWTVEEDDRYPAIFPDDEPSPRPADEVYDKEAEHTLSTDKKDEEKLDEPTLDMSPAEDDAYYLDVDPAPEPALGAPKPSVSLPEVPVDDTAPDTLGEKKRYFAAVVQLTCRPEIIAEARGLVADIAFKLDGIIHEQKDNQVVALFGIPTSDENDVVTTIRFALDSREAIANLVKTTAAHHSQAPIKEHPSTKASIRIGIRAGIARLGGLPSKEGYQLLGNTLNETAALVEHSRHGQIAVAGLATRLAAIHYTLKEIASLKRYGKMVRVFRIVGPRTSNRHRNVVSVPLVGREVEFNAIRTSWREAVLQGGQRSLLLVGEAGIGKSRLIDEFLERHYQDVWVMCAVATPHRRGTPFSIVVDLLRAIPSPEEAERKHSLNKTLATINHYLRGTDNQLLEALTSILDPHDKPVKENKGYNRVGIHRALRELLNRLASKRPLIVVIENLHWADHASLKGIKNLVEQFTEATGTIFLLLSIRPDEGLPPQSIFDEHAISILQLEELDEADRNKLIALELSEHANDFLIQEVARRAGGYPFYIRELAAAIRELKVSGPAEVPPTVQGIVASRVDRLPPKVKSLLQHAAAIGPTFREGILAQLIGRNPARHLAVLRSRGIIIPVLRTVKNFESGSGKSSHYEREWAFRHVLFQEVVYEAISSAARRDLHRRVGEIMVNRGQRGYCDPPSEIARHLELGAKRLKAGEYYLRSANEAAAAYASQDALALYDRALRLSNGNPEMQYAVYAGRERVYAQLGLHKNQAEDLKALRPLCGNDPNRLADLYNRDALRLLRLGNFYTALSAAAQAETAAQRAGNNLAQGEALQLRGEAYERLSDHPRAIAAVTQALQIFEEQDAIPNQIRARVGLGRIHLVEARYDEAFEQYQPALDLTEATGDKWQERIVRNNLAVVLHCRGEFSQALDEAFYSLKLCEQFGDLARKGDNATVIGIVYFELGLYDLARKYLEWGIAIHQETGSKWSHADTLVYLGQVEAAFGNFRKALSILKESKAIAKKISAKFISINARNATAWVLCERGTTDDAARAIDEATEAAETARQARLIVGEIPGLSRSARATAILGNLDAAKALSRRAVELLEEQRIIETPEEEIFYTYYRILMKVSDPTARDYLRVAHEGYLSKLNRLTNPEWKKAFSEKVRLNVAIRRNYQQRSV